MPALFLWLQSLVLGVASGLTTWFTQRGAAALAYVAITSAAAAGLATAVTAAINGLLVVAPSFVVIGASWVLPPVLPSLIATYFSVRLLCASYLFASTWRNPLRSAG